MNKVSVRCTIQTKGTAVQISIIGCYYCSVMKIKSNNSIILDYGQNLIIKHSTVIRI